MTERKIVTEWLNLPWHKGMFDWCASLEGYEPGDAIGRGASEEQAIADLAEQLD